MENSNINIRNFATELGKLIGQHIGLDHIHPSAEGRYYYIQAPKSGAPLLLHHYRGPLFIDIYPDDFESIYSGRVSAHEYITSANWQVGYYWGGGSMVGGGYYQPLDLIGRRDEVKRYLQILSCRGYRRASGYMPSERRCVACSVVNCPFSKYKEGNWSAEICEPDPRRDLFSALKERFERENHGYTLRGFLCDKIPDEEIWVSAQARYIEDEPFALVAYASDSVIQLLLMHETEPKDWNDYANTFQFRICNIINQKTCDVTMKSLKKAFDGLDYTKKANE